jgi:hypothetical protein
MLHCIEVPHFFSVVNFSICNCLNIDKLKLTIDVFLFIFCSCSSISKCRWDLPYKHKYHFLCQIQTWPSLSICDGDVHIMPPFLSFQEKASGLSHFCIAQFTECDVYTGTSAFNFIKLVYQWQPLLLHIS